MSLNGQLPDSALAPIKQGRLTIEAAAAWNAMNVEARQRGIELTPTGSASSYRTLAQQKALFAKYLAGGNLAAQPGTSNHGWGLAVDVPTRAMRDMIDTIGAMYGWAKKWSDAPSEWWHIKYEAGHWSGSDPGPDGVQEPSPSTKPQFIQFSGGSMNICVMQNKDGRLEVFVLKSDGSVWHRWQKSPNGDWSDWASFGKP